MLRGREIVLIAFIAIVTVGSVAFDLLDPWEDPEDPIVPDVPVFPQSGDGPSPGPVPGTTVVEDLTVVDPQGLFSVTCTRDGDSKEFVFVLRDDIASQYVGFQWYVMGDSYYGETAVKTNPEATWTVTEELSGEFTINVKCVLPDSGSWLTMYRTHSASMYLGTIERGFVWSYDDVPFAMTVVMDYPTYSMYDGVNGAPLDRRGAYDDGTYSVIHDFMVVDPTVESVASQLGSLYSKAFGEPEGQGYAEFVLAFVQSCIGYREDILQYGQEEYFAFPLETLFHRVGDCEDLSILFATIMDASGYDSGVFLIPGHAVGAVALDDYVPGDVSAEYRGGVDGFSLTYGDRTYYGCETTLGSNAYGIGWIDDEYGIDARGNITYEGEVMDRDLGFGLYPLENDAVTAQ